MSRNKKPALRRPCESKNHLEIFTTSGNGAINLVPGLKSDSTDFRNSGNLWKELRTRPHSEGFCWREMWCCKGPFHSEGRGGGGAARRLTVCICVCVCLHDRPVLWRCQIWHVSSLWIFPTMTLPFFLLSISGPRRRVVITVVSKTWHVWSHSNGVQL